MTTPLEPYDIAEEDEPGKMRRPGWSVGYGVKRVARIWKAGRLVYEAPETASDEDTLRAADEAFSGRLVCDPWVAEICVVGRSANQFTVDDDDLDQNEYDEGGAERDAKGDRC